MLLLERLFAFIAPYDCLVCGDEGALVCESCKMDALDPTPSRCYRCQRVTQDYEVCQKCRSATSLKNVWVVTPYEYVAKQLVHGLKFERRQEAAKIIADYMANRLPYFGSEIVISHVPTANRRVRQRGYDQAELIAKHLADQRKLTYQKTLFRQGHSRQVGASKKVRQSQLESAFVVVKPAEVAGKTILLVDDIVTTGATLESAAKTLKHAGAKTVLAITFAQKI